MEGCRWGSAVAVLRNAETPAPGNLEGEKRWRRIISVNIFHSFYWNIFFFYPFRYRIVFPSLCHFTRKTSPKVPRANENPSVLVSWSWPLFFYFSVFILIFISKNSYVNTHTIAHLILSINRKQRKQMFQSRSEGLCGWMFFPWGPITPMFLETLWELCILCWTIDFLDLERTSKKIHTV